MYRCAYCNVITWRDETHPHLIVSTLVENIRYTSSRNDRSRPIDILLSSAVPDKCILTSLPTRHAYLLCVIILLLSCTCRVICITFTTYYNNIFYIGSQLPNNVMTRRAIILYVYKLVYLYLNLRVL